MVNPIVKVNEGKLKGKLSKNENGFEYITFMGIPYAKPPVGELRFSIPQPPEAWEGVRDATKISNICAHTCVVTRKILGTEDCLYLNVYTPKLPSVESQLLPVMVYIHGGGFFVGNGTDVSEHGPDFLIEKDVVIVSINYRLGIFGFLCLDRKEAPGNMGMMDQVQALKWVQKNIASFGGNPNSVTIFGCSAGGASVTYHMLSPMSKGLFHKAIAQSGCSLLSWAHNPNARKLASKIPALHNKSFSNDEQLLKYLKSLTTLELLKTFTALLDEYEYRGGINLCFVPTVEKSGNWEPFLSKAPYELLAQGKFNRVPFITGFCTREGLLMMTYGAPALEKFLKNKSFVDFLPFDLGNEEKSDMEIKLKANYLEGPKVYYDVDAYAIDFFTDVDFLAGKLVFAKLIAKHNNPVYFYEFSYDGNFNCDKKIFNIDRAGACHADEEGYLLKDDRLIGPLTDADSVVRDTMTTLWTNIAKYGNPTPKLDDLISTKWEPITESEVPCLVVDKTIKIKSGVYPQRVKLLEDLYLKEYARYAASVD